MGTIDLSRLDQLDVHAQSAEVVTWNGRPALRLENGLALLQGLEFTEGALELDLGVEAGAAAYPGVAFHAEGAKNYELIYCQPHTSGQWDALQYDPVFRGSNTWQVFNGPGCQAQATVPAGQWITLRVDVAGGKAAARLLTGDGALPLVVPGLAHGRPAGRLGVWTYLPAYFSQLRIWPAAEVPAGARHCAVPAGTVTDWWLEGSGQVEAEPHGSLCLNRYLNWQPGAAATLTRTFEAVGGEAMLELGFSDEIRVAVDDQLVFEGTNLFTGFADRPARGYVEVGARRVPLHLSPGRHTLRIILRVTEGFGWGLTARLSGGITL